MVQVFLKNIAKICEAKKKKKLHQRIKMQAVNISERYSCGLMISVP